MSKFRIYRENGPDLMFDGELMAKVFDPKTSMAIFKTSSRLEKNLFVCVSQIRDEKRTEVVRSHEDIVTFFGMSTLAKRLYKKIGIDKDYYIIDFTKYDKYHYE